MRSRSFKTNMAAALLSVLALLISVPVCSAAADDSAPGNQVLEWNQIFIDTANSSSQRLGAIVHTAIFDSLNGIDRRYTPIFIHSRAPQRASRRAAVITAAYTALLGLFPSQQPSLDARYAASLTALNEHCEKSSRFGGQCDKRIARGIETRCSCYMVGKENEFNARFCPRANISLAVRRQLARTLVDRYGRGPCPMHRADVVLEVLRALRQVRKVLVWQVDHPLAHIVLSQLNEKRVGGEVRPPISYPKARNFQPS
jgi:hypothetical protein